MFQLITTLHHNLGNCKQQQLMVKKNLLYLISFVE
jgi:hypothetical protein